MTMTELYNRFHHCVYAKYTHVENDASFALDKFDEGSFNRIYINFQGSETDTDWKNNFDFPINPYRDMENKWYCHRGFLKVWKSAEPYLADAILDPTTKEIRITGYSHGAALALLCYEYVKFHRPDVSVTGVGFGCPRVVWGKPKEAVMKRFEGFLVVRNGKDIVTHVPPAIIGYRHVGNMLKLKGGWGLTKDHYAENYLDSMLGSIVKKYEEDIRK